jgi:ribosome-associated translation inhibitor RaiA
MPEGVVLWVDVDAGEARIARGGREYAARVDDLESAARHGGARVHFDVQRVDGAEMATNVELRHGSRTAARHRRVGTLVGAHHGDTRGPAPFARPHPDYGLALAGHPLAVVVDWADAVVEDDLDRALLLYAPDARVFDGDQPVTGRGALQALLETLPGRGTHHPPTVSGEGPSQFLARWEEPPPEAQGLDVHTTVRHGHIAEQRIGPLGADTTTEAVEVAGAPLAVNVTTTGAVDPATVDYARQRVAHLAETVDQPILFARVKLTLARDPARTRPALAQATLDLDGELLRAHVAANEMREAIDLLQRRLRDKLEHARERREWLRRHQPRRPEPGERRHGAEPTERPEYFDRPVDEREIVRHKSFTEGELTPDEAAFEMDQLDFDFHLFRDLATGDDALIERSAGGTYVLHRTEPSTIDMEAVAAYRVEPDPARAPELTVSQARERLDAGGERFVFFTNTATGRGNVLYHRYDGHYGLLMPEG